MRAHTLRFAGLFFVAIAAFAEDAPKIPFRTIEQDKCYRFRERDTKVFDDNQELFAYLKHYNICFTGKGTQDENVRLKAGESLILVVAETPTAGFTLKFEEIHDNKTIGTTIYYSQAKPDGVAGAVISHPYAWAKAKGLKGPFQFEKIAPQNADPKRQ